jgi:hypothetical protein
MVVFPLFVPKPWTAVIREVVILQETGIVVRIAVMLTGARGYKYVV